MDAKTWLLEKDELWRDQLRGVSLVAEADIDHAVALKTAQAFGVYQRQAPLKLPGLFHDYPAATVVTMSVVANHVYREGTFWKHFWEVCGAPNTPTDAHDIWGSGFLKGLAKLGLPRFEDLPLRYLGPILMHSGIPESCLNDYFELLEQSLRSVGATGEASVQWMIARDAQNLVTADKPVRRFVKDGNEFAIDFVDRSIDLMIRLNRDESIEDLALPQGVIKAASKYLETKAARREGTSFSGKQARAHFSIRLHPYAGRIVLQLPALEDAAGGFIWRITTDDEVGRVNPGLRMGGRTIGIRPATWEVSRPTRRLAITAQGVTLEKEIRVFEDGSPCLYFDESGEFITGAELPAGRVWVLFADPSRDATLPTGARLLEEDFAPAGWPGWRLWLIDLTDVSSISLPAAATPRTVRARSRASMTTGHPLNWITLGGLPVHSERPTVLLPDTPGVTWQVSVRNIDADLPAVTQAFTSAAGAGGVDPFATLDGPAHGRFEVTVRGPLGRGLKQTIAMVEGLTVSPAQPWRRITHDGLERLDVALRFSDGARDDVSIDLPFDAATSVLPATLMRRGIELDVMVRPPSMAIAVASNGVPGRWVHGFARLDAEDVAGKQLYVRVRQDEVAAPLVVMSRREQVGSVPLSPASAPGLARYNLESLADTLREHGSCQLEFLDGSRNVRACAIRPRLIATGIAVEQGDLVLQGFTGGSVIARVWTPLAPWLGACDLTVDEQGHCALPSTVDNAGTIAVSFAREDPWVPADLPTTPTVGKYLLLERDPGPDAHPLTIAVLSQHYEGVECTSTELIHLMLMARALPLAPLAAVRFAALAEAAGIEPFDMLHAMLDFPMSADDRLYCFLLARLAIVDLSSASEDEDLRDLIAVDASLGALAAVPALCRMDAREALAGTWEQVAYGLGQPAMELLQGGADPAAGVGSLRATGPLAAMPPAQFEALLASFSVVPKALLDRDSRFTAALEVFRNRETAALQSVARDGRQRLEVITAALKEVCMPHALQTLKLRAEEERPGGWQSLTAQSFGLALMARLAARGNAFAASFAIQNLAAWLKLADTCPRIVSVDLALAELHVARHFAQALPTYQAPQPPEESEA